MRQLIPFFFAATVAWCQPFSAGVKVGVPLTDFLSTVNGTTSATTNRYLIGVTAELHLPLGLGIEGDAIYRHFSFQNILTLGRPVDAGGSGTSTVTETGSNGNWEFPLLLKYRFPTKIVHPFIDGGVAWDTLTGVSNAAQGGLAPVRKTVNGIVMGAGIDVHFVIQVYTLDGPTVQLRERPELPVAGEQTEPGRVHGRHYFLASLFCRNFE